MGIVDLWGVHVRQEVKLPETGKWAHAFFSSLRVATIPKDRVLEFLVLRVEPITLVSAVPYPTRYETLGRTLH